MDKLVSSIDEILKAMPLVQDAVCSEVAARIAAGEDICHVEDGNVMINDRIVMAVTPAIGASPKRAQRQAA